MALPATTQHRRPPAPPRPRTPPPTLPATACSPPLHRSRPQRRTLPAALLATAAVPATAARPCARPSTEPGRGAGPSPRASPPPRHPSSQAPAPAPPHEKGGCTLPGGKAEEGDADDAATSLREAKEEIGLDPALVTVVSSLEHFLPKSFPGWVTLPGEGQVPELGMTWEHYLAALAPPGERIGGVECHTVADVVIQMFWVC
nr:predicted GPI-anchored protein 58 [Aegilops tauschii subsp. strangulata]